MVQWVARVLSCKPRRTVETMIRVYASDPAYPEIDRAADWLAKLKNPSLFWDLKDMPEMERLVNIKDLEDLFEELAH